VARPVSATARSAPDAALAGTFVDQVAIARRQLDWHLARARAAGVYGGTLTLDDATLGG